MPEPADESVATRSAVRRNAIWATGAAMLMLYYGMRASVPDSWPPYEQGWILFVYTLRIGGGAMAVSAALSLVGVPFALLVDGVLSVFIGLALGLSGPLIYGEDSHQAVFTVLFGVIFVYAGYRNLREYGFLTSIHLWVTSTEPEEDEPARQEPRPPELPVPTAGAEGDGDVEAAQSLKGVPRAVTSKDSEGQASP